MVRNLLVVGICIAGVWLFVSALLSVFVGQRLHIRRLEDSTPPDPPSAVRLVDPPTVEPYDWGKDDADGWRRARGVVDLHGEPSESIIRRMRDSDDD
jgi:hypothetical protein